MHHKAKATKDVSDYKCRKAKGCLAGAEPNGPVVVIIPTLGMSLAHGNPLRRPIPHGEYESRWLSPECQLVGSDPHKHVRMSTMANNQTICRKYQVLMSNNMECVKYLNGLSLCHHFSPRGTGLPDLGPVSQPAPENPTFGNRSLPARDRSLPRRCARGPVSTARDRLPRRHRSTVHWGTGLSYQGPVPESKNSQDSAKTLEIELLGRYTIDGPPPVWKSSECKSNTRTSQFAKVQCATFTPPKKEFCPRNSKVKAYLKAPSEKDGDSAPACEIWIPKI
uniref:Uncharacterized protein n=1 Tax=Ananas comosus var. bracteatus TaxID=296719 RepID=A0A6V7PQ65_ANACO|nr:unnamed protein product [Ananas comosus var. bracteatus]